MTPHPNQTIQGSWNLRAHSIFALSASVCIIASAALISCGEEEAPPPPIVRAEPPPPPPPPEPTVKSIAELMTEYDIDSRIDLPETLAPDTNEKRIAVLKFWNAFAKGDDQYASGRMAELDRKVLNDLVKSGSWKTTTGAITSIEVQCKDDEGGFATFGLITAGGAEQAMLWDAVQSGDDSVFTAFPGTHDILAHLSGEDSIGSWKIYINGLFEKYSNLPDEQVEIPQSDVQLAEGSDSGVGGGGETPAPPDGGGGGGSGGGVLKKKPHAPLP